MNNAARTFFRAITGTRESNWETPDEARAGLLHVLSLSFTKLSDGLINPKLVMSWLLNVLGVPAYIIGLLVPIREAGALLPQVFLAPRVERMKMRRWVWVFGSAVQGLAALGIALSAALLSGVQAGWAICGALAVLAVARAACSVSYSEILGKTVGQTRRGAVTGLAGSIGSLGVFIFALLMVTGVLQSQTAVIGAIALAGVLWLCAAATFSQLPEEPSVPKKDAGVERLWIVLRDDANLRQFVLVRGLLVSTALAPPYLVLLAGEDGGGLGELGTLVLASALASFVSSYVWGRLADISGRKALGLAGLAGAIALFAAAVAGAAGIAQNLYVIPAILFVLMLAYHGVRQARATYLVDVAPKDSRTSYAAAANTVIGVILLIAGFIGGALSWIGPYGAIIGFAVMAAVGGVLALRLEDA